ncbi:MAG: relaxase [Rhizobiaceae bacterium]|nr:relaxase [Rhizobiaceae bacterium]
MILHGNQRGGANDMALHLMKDENERVEVHELRGFVSSNLAGAFQESYAISRGTNCKQHLFSLSINPPKGAHISTQEFVDAFDLAEINLGLSKQPRAIVFHEKLGLDGELRRHAHAVWCRIDAENMKAVQLSFTHQKLREVSRELHIQHDLKIPSGLINSKDSDPRNYTLAEWQQCKRAEKDPKQVKSVFQDAWSISDTKASFANALEERGFILAQGRRGHVAVDYKGEKYAVSRYVGIKAKQVRARLGEAGGLPSIEQAQTKAAEQIVDRLKELHDDQRQQESAKKQHAEEQKKQTESAHAHEEEKLNQIQNERQIEEENEREARIRTGWRGLLDRVTGRRKQTEALNEIEATNSQQKDKDEQREMREKQEIADRNQQKKFEAERLENLMTTRELETDIEQLRPTAEPPPDIVQSDYATEQRDQANKANEQYRDNGPELYH